MKDKFILETVQNCPLCKNAGQILYKDCPDYSLHQDTSHDLWNWFQCSSKECACLYLNPRPNLESIHLAYQNYYTYSDSKQTLRGEDSDSQAPNSTSSSNSIQTPSSWKEILRRLYQMLLDLTPLAGWRSLTENLGIEDEVPGRLLEIGCGSADRLKLMQNKGWTVLGQDIDPNACIKAEKKHGLTVYNQPVSELPIEKSSMDVVVLSHVIEHLHEPKKMVEQALQLVKPGGKLILITPNAQSMTRKIFGRYWYPLEHPRHLILYNSVNIQTLFENQQHTVFQARTSPGNAQFFSLFSAEILQKGTYHLNHRTLPLSNILAGVIQMIALFYWKKNTNSGDELIVKVTR